jgi:peptide-methionine (S)-S-oxide reductase/peptide methionine sulfoxide reductase msrA/msrB
LLFENIPKHPQTIKETNFVMNIIEKALHWALQILSEKTDAQGAPLILQAVETGVMGTTDEERSVGFLSLAIKEFPQLAEDLRADGFPNGLVNTLLLFSEGTDESANVEHILQSGNPLAMQVKCNALQVSLAHSAENEEGLKTLVCKLQEALHTEASTQAYQVNSPTTTAIFAGGCFWGVQHEFQKEKGVLHTLVGYTGGKEVSPTYTEVRAQQTHHVEAVIIEFDPALISYERLVQIFFEMHDPSQTDGVGPDIGTQYRSVIFYLTQQQQSQAQCVIEDLRSRGYEVNTLLLPSSTFWVGEEYHQQYYEKTGGEPYCHIRQKKF